MAVTLSDVDHVARLARLEFTAEEKQQLTIELNAILAYMEQLDALDTDAVEPLAQVIESSNVFRTDVHTPGLTREEALRNAPERTEEFFVVPKVLTDR